MRALLDFFNSFAAGFSFSADRKTFDFFTRCALSSLLFLFSAIFLFFCALRIKEECAFASAESRGAAADSQIVEDAKKISFDRVLYDDFVNSRNSTKGGELFSPFAISEKFIATESESNIPRYAPTVVIKAIATLGEESICVLDIDGEEPGKVFRSGDSFGDGQGRIVKISGDGVRWKWQGREYTTGF